MTGRWGTGLRAAGLVSLVSTGVWVGHLLEYLRLSGTSGLRQAVLGPTHLYMLPLAVVLTALTARFGLRCWGLWRNLGRLLAHERSRLRVAWRGGRGSAPAPRVPVCDEGLPILAIWAPLAVAQIALYLLQENVEAVFAGGEAPGLGAVTGVHWTAPLIHSATALVLAALVALVTRRLHRRWSTLDRCQRLLHLLWPAPRYQPQVGAGSVEWSPSPVERFGPLVWSRPPPTPSTAPG
jgi:hypothetical protein